VSFVRKLVSEKVPVEGAIPEVDEDQHRVERVDPGGKIARLGSPVRETDVEPSDAQDVAQGQPSALVFDHKLEREHGLPHPEAVDHVAATQSSDCLLHRKPAAGHGVFVSDHFIGKVAALL